MIVQRHHVGRGELAEREAYTLRAEELERRPDEKRHADHLVPASQRTTMKVAALCAVKTSR